LSERAGEGDFPGFLLHVLFSRFFFRQDDTRQAFKMRIAGQEFGPGVLCRGVNYGVSCGEFEFAGAFCRE